MNATLQKTIWPAYSGGKVEADIQPGRKMDAMSIFHILYAEHWRQLEKNLHTAQRIGCRIQFSALCAEQRCHLPGNVHRVEKNGCDIHT